MPGPRKWWRSLRKLWLARRLGPGRIVVHKGLLKGGLPRWLVLAVLAGGVRGRLETPAGLTLVTVHNRDHETLFERSLRHTGLSGRVVRVPAGIPWRHGLKIPALLDFLRRNEPTEYVLFCDADDCLIRDDPRKAIELLEEAGCDLLFSDSPSDSNYEHMPDVRAWAHSAAPDDVQGGRYPGAGVFIGRWDFLVDYLADAARYLRDPQDPDPPRPVAFDPRRPESILATVRQPFGVDDDEVIHRFLHRRYHPRVQVDYRARLALRSNRAILG